MTIQLGINPLTWTNDDLPSLGAETSLETCLSEGKSAGFAGFELGNTPVRHGCSALFYSATIYNWFPVGIRDVCWNVAWRRRLTPYSRT